MDRKYYGTFLTHLVEQTIINHPNGVLVKDIIKTISPPKTSDIELYNLEKRIRRCLGILETEGALRRELFPGISHIPNYKYFKK